MRRSLHRWVGIPCLAFLLSVETLYGQSILRLGGEFQVNGFTAGHQGAPAVADDDDGDFVISWSSETLDGSGFGVFARRFNSIGAPLASELQVNAYTLNHQNNPALDLDGDGDFVVVWDGTGGLEQSGVFARRFSSAGAPLAADLQVNTFTNDSQYDAAVAADADGDFVVVWNSFLKDGSQGGIFAQRFSSAGMALGIEFQVNRSTVASQRFPSVGRDGDGDFVVVWQSPDQDGYGVFAQRFDSAGARSGVELQVNSYTGGNQSRPVIALDGNGDFTVAWLTFGQDAQGWGIAARRFNAAGTPQAAEFLVNTYQTNYQLAAAIAANKEGDFVIVWQSTFQDGDLVGIFGQSFNAAGAPVSVEFQVNTYTANDQLLPVVSLDSESDVVAAWASTGQDGNGSGVFAQRFKARAVLDVDGNGSVAPLTDGVLILRFLFGFTGTTLSAGAVDLAHCTRCNADTIVPYLEGLV